MPTISVHVDDDTLRQVEALAGQLDRSKSWVVGDALRPYLDHHAWMIASAERARDDLQCGRLTPVAHSDAVADILSHVRSQN